MGLGSVLLSADNARVLHAVLHCCSGVLAAGVRLSSNLEQDFNKHSTPLCHCCCCLLTECRYVRQFRVL